MLWRLNIEMRRGAGFPEQIEHRAARIGAPLLFLLAIYVFVVAIYGLLTRQAQDFLAPGLIVALVAIPLMWRLARKKAEVADQLASKALYADAIESTACGYLSGVVVVGLIAQLIMPGWWWVDSIASLAIVVLLVREGCRIWKGDE